MRTTHNKLRTVYRGVMRSLVDIREIEYNHAMKFLEDSQSILDVGCGKGGFLELAPGRIHGIDINPDNVDICIRKGLKAKVGSALEIPYDDDSFDGALCSHVIQVFTPHEVARFFTQLSRVVRSGGCIVLITIPMYQRTFMNPADVRPYPPQAIRSLLAGPSSEEHEHSAPTMYGLPHMSQEGLWQRRPPLIEFQGPGSWTAEAAANLVNTFQYTFFLRKYWSYTGYVMKLRNSIKNGVSTP